MAIAAEELAGSPRISISQQGTVAVRTFRVAWDAWQEFARLLIGTYRTVGSGSYYIPPLPFPGLPNLIVWDLAIEPLDPDSPDGAEPVTLETSTNRYPSGGAKVTATYRTLIERGNRGRRDLPSVPQGTYLTFSADLGAEFHPMPGRLWRWSAGDELPVPDDVQPSLLIPTGSLQLTWLRVLHPPWGQIQALRGKVNSGTFLGAAPGTLLFLGVRATRELQFVEDGGFWRLEYAFAEQSKPLAGGGTAGWNHFYKEEAEGGEHWLAIEDQSGNPPYADGDFNLLFTYE